MPQLVFGAGSRSTIAEHTLQYGATTLLITGKSSFQHSVHYAKLLEDFKAHEVDVTLTSIAGEPSPATVDKIVEANRAKDISSVVAIGGGSVMDAGKAVAAMLSEEGSVKDYLEGVGHKLPSGKNRPFIAVPTTSGTGSETTANAVLSEVGPEGFKKSLRHNKYVPDIAIIDPELSVGCPPSLTAACGMDCFTQLVEGYLSTNSSPLTDSLALQGIAAISRSLRTVVEDGSKLGARSDLSYAAMLSGIVLANAGLGTVHGFASAIGGVINAPHGSVCGTLMEPANRLTLQRLREESPENVSLEKYTQLGKMFSHDQGQSNQWYQDHFIDTLARLNSELNIADFSSYRIADEEKQRILEATDNKYNPVKLERDDLKAILNSRC